MFAVKHNIPQIKDKLERLRRLVSTQSPNVQEDFLNQMEKARKIVKKLTPRSEGAVGSQKGKHIADGWTVHTIGGSGKDRVPMFAVVYNKFTHNRDGSVKPSARLRRRGGGKSMARSMRGLAVRQFTLLEVLEYGSPPHVIEPVVAKMLHFTTKSGKEVFTVRVDHPGTKPYGMVRVARAKMKYLMGKLVRRWDRKIKKEWKR